MMIRKRLLAVDRVRRPPREGFSWLDRRFLREHAPALDRDAILLYFFLAAVADKDGLSFYADATTAARLRLDERAVTAARETLLQRGLIAHESPLTQVLALPERSARGRDCAGAELVGDILRRMAAGRGQP
jgi:hypothetical protein